MIKFALILLLCTGAFAQRPGFGKCPKWKVVQDFDIQRHVGTWYQYGRFYASTELGGKCNKAEVSLNPDGTLKVVRSQVNIYTGKTTSTESIAKLSGKPGEAKFSVTYPSAPIMVKLFYGILDTDYTGYYVLYTCQNFGLFHTISAWIYTKERFPDGNTVEKALAVFDHNGMDKNLIVKVQQEDCE